MTKGINVNKPVKQFWFLLNFLIKEAGLELRLTLKLLFSVVDLRMLNWLGHVSKMLQQRLVCKTFCSPQLEKTIWPSKR